MSKRLKTKYKDIKMIFSESTVNDEEKWWVYRPKNKSYIGYVELNDKNNQYIFKSTYYSSPYTKRVLTDILDFMDRLTKIKAAKI